MEVAAMALCLAGHEQGVLRSLSRRAAELGNCREGSSGILCEPDLTTGLVGSHGPLVLVAPDPGLCCCALL